MPDVDLVEITKRAVIAVSGVAHGPAGLIAALLKPRPEDYAAVFVGNAAEQAAEHFALFWENPPGSLTRAPNPQIRMVSRLAQDIVASDEFPGGYSRIAHLLVPDQVWCRFKVISPGADSAIAYDGLVWREDRWAWFPKPWRAFSIPATN